MIKRRVGNINFDHSTSSTLIHCVKAGEGLAWRELIKVYGPSIWRWIHRKGVRDSELEDIFQDVCLTVHRQIEHFQRQRTGSFRAWLKRVTHSRVNDYFRMINKSIPTTHGVDNSVYLNLGETECSRRREVDDDAEDHLELAALVQRVLQTIKSEFREQTWTCFQMSVFDELDSRTVAARLGLTAEAVRKNKSRVLHHLRKALLEAGAVE